MKLFRTSVAISLVAILITLSIAIVPAWAKIYKWKDENGKLHFTDSPSKIPKQYRKQKGKVPYRKKKSISLQKQKAFSGTEKSTATSLFNKSNVTVRYDFYDIRGQKANDLRKQMDALGPYSDEERRNFDARTQGQVSWKLKYRFQDDECLEFIAFPELRISYTMPKWVNYSKGSAKLRKRWDEYYGALDTHEQGHGKHHAMALEEIENSLPKLQKGISCQELEQTFKKKANEIIKKYNRIDAKYEEDTRHGFTQGAVFP